jgi:hypothetical protein
MAPKDAMCQTLAAQEDWLAAEWLAVQHKPATQALKRALDKAIRATMSIHGGCDR